MAAGVRPALADPLSPKQNHLQEQELKQNHAILWPEPVMPVRPQSELWADYTAPTRKLNVQWSTYLNLCLRRSRKARAIAFNGSLDRGTLECTPSPMRCGYRLLLRGSRQSTCLTVTCMLTERAKYADHLECAD